MKRLERGIALRVTILFVLVTFASIGRGPLRWIMFVAALGVAASIFWYPRSAYPERLTVTISEYGVVDGQLRIAGMLTNSGTLDVYRPELIFSIEDGHGTVVASHSLWPTGQVKRNVSVGQNAPFVLALPAPADPTQARLSIKSPQYPFELAVTCDPNGAVPRLRAV